MTAPGPGFAVEVGELERHAAELPQVAAAMRTPLAILREHTASPRPQEVAAVSAVEHEYGTFTEELANRQSRAADLVEDVEEWPGANPHRRSSRSSRKGATMVFLGVWALFGVGALAGGKSPLPTGLVGRTGKVLARADVPVSFTQPTSGAYSVDSFISAQVAGEPAVFESVRASESTDHREPEQPDMERIIGRISAWMCTTLYLTSRLPQIWKNVSEFHWPMLARCTR